MLRRAILGAAAAAVALTLLPAPANGDTYRPSRDGRFLARAESFRPVAERTFTPACGRPRLVVADLPAGTAAGAYVNQCVIAFARAELWLPNWLVCTALAHEYGHLAGFGHVHGQPWHVMNDELASEWRPCERAARRWRVRRLGRR